MDKLPKLIMRKRYRFTHARKGVFEGVYLGRVKTPKGDMQDHEFLTVAIDTSDGTGNEWLRRAKDAEATTTNIRPSLLTSIAEVK